MTSLKQKAQSAVLDARDSAAWGHVVGIGGFFVVALFVPVWPEAFEMPKVLALTALSFACVPLVWSRRASLRNLRAPLAILGVFVVLALASQLMSGAPQLVSLWGDWSRRLGTITVFSLALLLCVGAVLTRRETKTALAWLMWSGVPAVAYGLVQIAGRDPIPWADQGWIFATFGNPNFAAAGLAMLALLTAGLALTKTYGTIWRVLMVPLAALEALVSLATGSNVAVFCLAVGCAAGLVVVALRLNGPRRTWAIGGICLAVVAGAALTALGLVGLGPVAQFLASDTLTFRGWYWAAAVGMAIDHPVVGVGPDGYGYFYGEYRSLDATQLLAVGSSSAHNVPLQWTATLGIPAGVAYVALMVTVAVMVVARLWRQGSAASPVAMPLVALWAAYQVQSLVSIDAIAVAFFGWLATGLLLNVTSDEPAAGATSTKAWLAAGALGMAGVLVWVPALTASIASQGFKQGGTDDDVWRAVDLVQGTVLPCSAASGVASWMVSTVPAQETVEAVYAGAESRERCGALYSAGANYALQLGDDTRAVAFASEAVELDPLNFTKWLFLARAQHAAGDDEGAVASLQEALTLAPGSGADIQALADELGLDFTP